MNQRRLFIGCFISLIATAFGFAVRGAILDDWRMQFDLTETQKGIIQGVGLYPFAISIILFSLIVDKIGYGTAMVFAFVGHVASAIITISATSFEMLYIGTFIFALANGIVESVINPVVATMFDKNKTHWLNVLHAGWPGGLVLGGLLAIAVLVGGTALGNLPGHLWQWQVGLVLIPTLIYGAILAGQKFPVQERVAAGVSYMDMLKEFGWGSSYICFFLLFAGFNQILVVAGVPSIDTWMQAVAAIVPTVLFGLYVKSFGRPMFVFLLLVMFLLATTELGTDSWISDIMRAVLKSPTKGVLFLVYTSSIMFVLRFFAGGIVHRLSPLGLLALCSAVASGGLLWLASAGDAVGMLLVAATFYGFGKSFFWPTTLGVVTEQYPKGGALMLNAIAGVGMLAVGVIGGPLIGTIQDMDFVKVIQQKDPALAKTIITEKPGIFGKYSALDSQKTGDLSKSQQVLVEQVVVETKQGTLGKIAILPAIMCVCYLILIGYFKSRGGYHAQVLTGHAAKDEEFVGGVPGPVEA
jgi:MFS family permease